MPFIHEPGRWEEIPDTRPAAEEPLAWIGVRVKCWMHSCGCVFSLGPHEAYLKYAPLRPATNRVEVSVNCPICGILSKFYVERSALLNLDELTRDSSRVSAS